MSRSGNRVEPASGPWERVSTGSPAVRRWPWSRPEPGRSDRPDDRADDGRWGVARLVAQREAQRRSGAVVPNTTPVAAPDAPGHTASRDPDDPPRPPSPREPVPSVPPSPRLPLPSPPPVPRPPLPAPRRPHGVRPGPVVPYASDLRASRPRVEPDLSLFGFSRHTRGRLGARVFTAFFVVLFALIAVQTIASIV